MADYVLVDDNGNPVQPTSAARVGNTVLVDDNGTPLTHGDFLNRYGETVKRTPGDVISKIEGRKKNPPPNARGSVAPAQGLGFGGAILAGLKGIGADPEAMLRGVEGLFGGESDTEKEQLGLGDVQAPGETPLTDSGRAKEASSFAGIARRTAAAPTTTGKIAAASGYVPLVGDIAGGVLQPAVAMSENRPITPEENEAAISSAAMAYTMLLPAAAKARVANILRARGVPVEADAPTVAPEPPVNEGNAAPAAALSEAQIDRLRTDTQLGNGMRNVPPKLAEAINSGAVEPDHASIREFVDNNPDVAAEVLKGYEMPGTETEAPPGEVVSFRPREGALGEEPQQELQRADASSPTPTPSALATIARKAAPLKELMDGVAPASASPEAADAADILRSSKAEIANDATIERVRNKEITKNFDRAGDEENIRSISEYERTGRFPEGTAKGFAPPGYSEMYRATTDAAHDSLRETYGDDRVGYVENYVRRAFKFGSSADEAKATGVLSNWIGSLSASKSPLKGRALGVPLDEALATMRNAGIEVRPATTNPELLRQWTVENANQARVYKQAWDDAKESKLIQFVRQGDRVPQGLVELNDRVAKVFRPTGQGMVQTGRWFAEPGVARIFNNAISKGLGGSPTFRAIRALNNAYNQMQLGLSAFHLTGTAINAGISDLSLGLQQLIQGDVASGAQSAARAAAPGLSFARDLYRGRAFINDLVADDPAARQVLAEKLNPAGGRLAVDQTYRNAAAQNMVEAWSNGRYVRALGNAPLAVVQKIASPLMDYAIPRVKIGAFLDLADANRQKLPLDASPTEIHRAYQQAWDSIDNRFGQLVHDNLFWNRTAADLAQVGTRSVGWNLGTVREIGGGVSDVLHGNLSPRALYSFALPVYAGLIGAAYMFLHTGKTPETTRDYFYPPNGLTDSKGRADRVALPTYMKDVFAYGDHPVTTVEHKASPLVSLAFDLGTNRDYFGDMIRNPDDSAARQWYQNGAYALRQLQPFSIQQAAKTWEEGGPTQAGEQFFGFVKAPAEMKQSAEDSEVAREQRRLANEETMRRAAERHGR